MRPRERRESGEQDLFRSRLDQIIAMSHPLVRLAKAINWPFLEEQFGAVYTDGAGRPPLPTRLMAGLAILKHTYNLSDEAVCALWVENPYYQYFCGEEFFQHELPFERSAMTNWRNRMSAQSTGCSDAFAPSFEDSSPPNAQAILGTPAMIHYDRDVL
jgi:IS5 family transposase